MFPGSHLFLFISLLNLLIDILRLFQNLLDINNFRIFMLVLLSFLLERLFIWLAQQLIFVVYKELFIVLWLQQLWTLRSVCNVEFEYSELLAFGDLVGLLERLVIGYQYVVAFLVTE